MRQESSAPAALQRLVQRAVLGVCVLAWASLCVQLLPMIGARGLLPVQPWLAELSARGVGLAELPTWTWLASSDGALLAGGLSGLALSAIGALGFAPRVCAAISGALYLGLALACRDLLSFQWDNLLIESCFLLALTPSDRESPLSLWLLRLLVFKLYFLSGVAKWQSHLGDWQDGSAMVAYYQTAPLPTATPPTSWRPPTRCPRRPPGWPTSCPRTGTTWRAGGPWRSSARCPSRSWGPAPGASPRWSP